MSSTPASSAKTHSRELRQHLSNVMTQRWRDHRNEMSPVLNSLAAARAKATSVPKSPAVRAAISKSRLGQRHSPETRAAMSLAHRARAKRRRLLRITGKLNDVGLDPVKAAALANAIVNFLDNIGE